MKKTIWLPLICAAVLAACQSKPTEKAGPPAVEAHHHEHKAPRGGRLVELGEEFAHLEVLHDAAAGKLAVYVLDGEAENPVRVPEAALTLVLPGGGRLRLAAVESSLTGEKAGDASEFSATDAALKGNLDLDAATIEAVTVKGARFQAVPLKSHGEEDGHEHPH